MSLSIRGFYFRNNLKHSDETFNSMSVLIKLDK
jgi:hypothetical protein